MSNKIETNVYLVKKKNRFDTDINWNEFFFYILRSLLPVRESENSALAREYFVTNNETCIILIILSIKKLKDTIIESQSVFVPNISFRLKYYNTRIVISLKILHYMNNLKYKMIIQYLAHFKI